MYIYIYLLLGARDDLASYAAELGETPASYADLPPRCFFSRPSPETPAAYAPLPPALLSSRPSPETPASYADLQKDHAPREQPKIKLREAKFLRANLIRPRQLPRLRPMATGFLRPYSASRPTLQLEWGVASARTAALCYTALVAILRELHATGSVSQLTDRLSYLSARLHGRPIVRRLSIKRERKATEKN